MEAGAVSDQPLAALWIPGEEVAQVLVANLGEVPLKSLPGGPLAQRRPVAHAVAPTCDSIVFSISSQDLAKASLPSSCSCLASASTSIPASPNFASS